MAKVNKRINTLTQLTDSNISMSGNLPLDLNNSEQTNRIKLSDTIKTPYATCSTAAATAVKVCEIQNFKDFALVGSLPVAVKFTYQNTAENVKIQIKYTDADGSAVTLDAKNAYAMNSPTKAIGYGDIPASSFVEFYYDSVADCFYMTDAPCGFGLGTCPTNTASAISQPTLSVTLSNNNAIALPTGYAFKVSFTYNYAYADQPLMSVNGGTALPVTVGGVAAGAGAFTAGRSYTFIATGSNFDCLSNCNLSDLPDLTPYAKIENLDNTLFFDFQSDGLNKFKTFLKSISAGKVYNMSIWNGNSDIFPSPITSYFGFMTAFSHPSNINSITAIFISTFTQQVYRLKYTTTDNWNNFSTDCIELSTGANTTDCNIVRSIISRTDKNSLNSPYKAGLTTALNSLLISSNTDSTASRCIQLSIIDTVFSTYLYKRHKTDTNTWSDWEHFSIPPKVTKYTLANGTSSEPNNCTYTVIGKTCIVNISAWVPSTTSSSIIVSNLPKALIRANNIIHMSSGARSILYIDANSTDLKYTTFSGDTSGNIYAQLIYPIA